MTKIVSINDVKIDTAQFTGFLQRALTVLDTAQEAALDFKEIVEEAATETKLDKKIVSKFFKARFKDSTKDVVKDGEMFTALIDAIDN